MTFKDSKLSNKSMIISYNSSRHYNNLNSK